MATIQEYKCPCCGGAIAFDSSLQKMKCPYCDTEFEMETLRSYDEVLKEEQPDRMRWDTTPAGAWAEGETNGLRTFRCESCGGEIVGDAYTAATTCPFCGSPVVMMDQFTGSLKPDLVIPFQLDKNAAKEALRRHYRGKKLLPPLFQEENHIDEVKGIYVPFWIFDADAQASIRYRTSRVRTWIDREYHYTERSYYSVHRGGTVRFAAVPVDGSSKMPDAFMESIEPFDLSQAVDFQTAYLAGFFADKYDVDAEQSTGRANERIKRTTEEMMASTVVGYATVTPESSSVQISGGRVRYALYPVWLLSTTWEGKNYTFAMNGQTGKLVGDLPVDKTRQRKYFWQTAAIAAAVAVVVQVLMWLL